MSFLRYELRGFLDLSVLDLFVWGTITNTLYSQSYERMEELREAVEEALMGTNGRSIRSTSL